MKQEGKRKRRSNSDIEESIMKAAMELIENGGFLELAVTGITKKAKIEPIVFYNRYNNLEDFVNEFVKKYDYWFSDVVKYNEFSSDKKDKYLKIMQSLLISLKKNKIMQQLLRWELANNNEITQRTAQLREINTLPLVKEFKNYFVNSTIDITTISAIIVSGIYYLILHSNLTTFSGIDINTEEGEKKVSKAIESLSEMLFAKQTELNKVFDIVEKMKQNNIPIEKISDCTGISIETINNMR